MKDAAETALEVALAFIVIRVHRRQARALRAFRCREPWLPASRRRQYLRRGCWPSRHLARAPLRRWAWRRWTKGRVIWSGGRNGTFATARS
jgi:hypothetical protein